MTGKISEGEKSLMEKSRREEKSSRRMKSFETLKKKKGGEKKIESGVVIKSET